MLVLRKPGSFHDLMILRAGIWSKIHCSRMATSSECRLWKPRSAFSASVFPGNMNLCRRSADIWNLPKGSHWRRIELLSASTAIGTIRVDILQLNLWPAASEVVPEAPTIASAFLQRTPSGLENHGGRMFALRANIS